MIFVQDKAIAVLLESTEFLIGAVGTEGKGPKAKINSSLNSEY